jgi:hypothetical protein
MKKYMVTITRSMLESIEVEVEAANPSEAYDKVWERRRSEELEKEFDEADGNGYEYEMGDVEEINPYAQWESLVIASLAGLINCTYQDAQDIVEAQEFYMAQSWASGLSAEGTAKLIEEKSKA